MQSGNDENERKLRQRAGASCAIVARRVAAGKAAKVVLINASNEINNEKN